MNDLALAFFLPAEENPRDLPGKMPRGAVIFGAAAIAGLVIWAGIRAANAASSGASGTDYPPPPVNPGPGPVPPGPVPQPTAPKPGGGGGGGGGGGATVPGWADPNPYGYNTQPGDPYVAVDGLWISPECDRWKMGTKWFETVAVPIIKQWIDNGWSSGATDVDVYTAVGSTWAWGYEVSKGILTPYLQQSKPQGPLCWDGFPWPWDMRGKFSQGELVYDQQTSEWNVVCPFATHEKWRGALCVDTMSIDYWEQEAQNYATNFPGLFSAPGYGPGDPAGLVFLIWEAWAAMGVDLPWGTNVQQWLNQLKSPTA